MAEKTIVDKAGETVEVGIAMASDFAGAIKTAFGITCCERKGFVGNRVIW
jgi:hypothetical protein